MEYQFKNSLFVLQSQIDVVKPVRVVLTLKAVIENCCKLENLKNKIVTFKKTDIEARYSEKTAN